MTTYQWLCIFGVQALITSIVGILVGLVTSGVQKKMADKIASTNDDQIIKEALQAMIRDRLYAMYDHASASRTITIEDQQNFLNLWDKYHRLGANGVMDRVKEEYLEFKLVRR